MGREAKPTIRNYFSSYKYSRAALLLCRTSNTNTRNYIARACGIREDQYFICSLTGRDCYPSPLLRSYALDEIRAKGSHGETDDYSSSTTNNYCQRAYLAGTLIEFFVIHAISYHSISNDHTMWYMIACCSSAAPGKPVPYNKKPDFNNVYQVTDAVPRTRTDNQARGVNEYSNVVVSYPRVRNMTCLVPGLLLWTRRH